MLTFFEYLRNRAYESIVSGATEALEFLENEKRESPIGGSEFIGPPRKRKALEIIDSVDETKNDAQARPDESSGAETVPAPRRRGRPRKQDAGGQ